jgi:serine/threonine protein kinase
LSQHYFLGTPFHEAPEVLLREKRCGHAVDIYALGCSLVRMALSYDPFQSFCLRYIGALDIEDPLVLRAHMESRTLQMLSILTLLGWRSWEGEREMYVTAERLKSTRNEEQCEISDGLIDASEQGIMAQLQEDFRGKITHKLDLKGLDFVQKCLTLMASRRLSAVTALEHDFLRQ